MTITDQPTDLFATRISLNADYPPVAMDMLVALVGWAEQDEALLTRFANWPGDWDQGQWAKVLDRDTLHLDYDYADPRLEESPRRAGQVVPLDALTQQVTQDVLGGVCQSAYCMAGQTVVQAGYRMLYVGSSGSNLTADLCIEIAETGEKDAKGRPVLMDVGRPQPIYAVAAERLGLTEEESNWLFDGDNQIRHLKEIVNTVATNRRLPLPYPDHGTYYGNDGSNDYDDDDSDD